MNPDYAAWPTSIDATLTAVFLLATTSLPALGYFFMFKDLRSYYRSLRRAMVVVGRALFDAPTWARDETPRCVAALGLSLPCSEEDLKQAYRQRAKLLHPDHGGDRRRFLYLQQHFEQALRHVSGTRSPS